MNPSPISAVPTHPSIALDSLRKFVREKVIPTARLCDADDRFPVELYRELHELGYLQAFIPAKLGGPGASTVDMAFILRELGYGSAGFATSVVANLLGHSPILLYGSEEARTRAARDSLESFGLWSFGMTEPNTGSDLLNSQATATRVQGGYVLNGSKCFITNANYARQMTIFARIPGLEPRKSMTAFHVLSNSPGLSTGKPMLKMGFRDSNTAEIHLNNVFVPEERRIGGEGRGMKVAFHSIHRSKTLLAASCIGLCHRASEIVVNDLSTRIRYGKPLLAVPAVRNQLAQIHTELEAAWLLTLRAAATWDTGAIAVKEASMAKLFSARMAIRFVGECVGLLGAYGFSREHELERLSRDVQLYEVLEGASFVQQTLVAKELFSDGLAERELDSKEAA